jgi:hypothetical protein
MKNGDTNRNIDRKERKGGEIDRVHKNNLILRRNLKEDNCP